MIKIKSPEEYNALVKAFRARKGKPLTNCFLMPDELAAVINEGKLFSEESEDWLLLLCDREDYYCFYYYTSENTDTADVKAFLKNIKDKEVFSDVVFRQGRGDTLTPSRLISDGVAEKYKTYQRMQLNVKDIDFSAVKVNFPKGYIMSTDCCDCEKISALWKEALDEKSTPLPKEEELKKLSAEGHLFTVFDGAGDLAAVIVLSVSGRQALIQHLAVSQKHRRKGLAAALMNRCFLSAKEEELVALRLWVDRENLSAVALYDRFDFQKDGMLCEQLYMKGF
ncbi:MAG: GNAT family N-acetyltransferase [Clostridia bacterium]|nr:GNAT family N-acetyltransferase [Clostridia bacterium]